LKENTMSQPSQLKHSAIYLLRLIVGVLLAVTAGGTRSPALDMVVDQLEIIGPRQWLWVMTGMGGTGTARHTAVIPASAPAHVGLAAANDNTRADELAHAS
jgi:hypothetical protein